MRAPNDTNAGQARPGRPAHPRRSRAMLVMLLLFAATVFAYLARLEAHTRADIFLPTDYHAEVQADGLTGEALDAFYATYAHQMGRPYTIRQDLLLCRLANIKAPPGYRGEAAGATVRALCERITSIAADSAVDTTQTLGMARDTMRDMTAAIGADSQLGDLVILQYIDDGTGLAGYVLTDGEAITIALRGTDDTIDTLDNILLLPFNLSVQYAPVRALLQTYGEAERIWLTGHSKGGHNAIYAASIDPRCRATGFNAPGFGIFLSDAQHDGLDRGVNYVINGDVTGFLLFHLERRVVLESSGHAAPVGLSFTSRHRLENFAAIDDLTVATRIQPLTVLSEWVTQIAWLLLVFLAGYGVLRLVWRVGRWVWRRMRHE